MPANTLIWLSTIAWFVLTGALFILLARWSVASGSWTILPGLVRGVRDWAAREPRERPTSSSSPGSLDAASMSPADDAAEIIEIR